MTYKPGDLITKTDTFAQCFGVVIKPRPDLRRSGEFNFYDCYFYYSEDKRSAYIPGVYEAFFKVLDKRPEWW